MLGLHIENDNIFGDIIKAKENNATCVQIFINKKQNHEKLKAILKKNKMTCVVHISYTINCAKNWDNNSLWIVQFIEEIELANFIGAKYCVIHLGKQLDLTLENSLNNMYTSLLYVHNKTLHTNVMILFETSTGQGTEIAYKLNELSLFYRKFSQHKDPIINNRFGICVDTCHIFAAGYNIKTKSGREIYFDNFNELIGLSHIKLIHLNDCKEKCGSHIDRHARIGEGFIGEKSLLTIAKIFAKNNVPIVLETPSENILQDLNLLASSL